MITGHPLVISVDKLSEDKTAAEKEASHHVAIPSLYECYNSEPLVSLPTTKYEHQEADEVGSRFSVADHLI